MLTIRFQRVGRKNQPKLRIVLQEKRSRLQGAVAEQLGWWDPLKKQGGFAQVRLQHWIHEGVAVSDSVWNLLVRQGILRGKKRPIKTRPKRRSA